VQGRTRRRCAVAGTRGGGEGRQRAALVSRGRVRAGARAQEERKVAGFIGTRRSGIWQAGMRRRIRLGLILEFGLPTEDEIGLTSGPTS
jgi:hypothetical protein